MKKKGIIAVCVVGVFVVVIGLINVIGKVGQAPSNGDGTEGMPVMVQAVESKAITATVSTKGTVELDEKEVIGAESIAKIQEVTVKVGDKVKAGDIVIQYDPKSKEDLEEQLEEARLSLRSAQLALTNSSLPPSQTELLQAQTQIDQNKQAISNVKSELEQLEIKYDAALKELKDAEDTYQKNLQLFNQGGISQSDLDVFQRKVDDCNSQLRSYESQMENTRGTLKTNEEVLKASEESYRLLLNRNSQAENVNQIEQQRVQVEQRSLTIQQLERQLEDFKLTETCSIDGTVIDIYVENASVTQAGDQIMTIGDIDSLIIKINLTEYDAPEVKVGQKVMLSGDSLRNKELEGIVRKVDPSAHAQQGTNGSENVVSAEIELVDKTDILKPGFTINAKIITADLDNAIVVPIMSIVNEKDNKNYVFVVTEDNMLEKREIEIITIATIEAAVTGLKEGEKIVSSPSSFLEDGMAVNPIEEDPGMGAGL